MKKTLVAVSGLCVLTLVITNINVTALPRQQSTNTPPKTPSPKIRFGRDIKPILAAKCFVCHGPDAGNRKARLRLDQPESARKKLRSGHRAIVPGDAAKSEMITRIMSSDVEEQMPPPDSKKHLTVAEKKMLRLWVEQGAEYERHWAFVAPVRPDLPTVRDKQWPKTPVDHFILARLEKEGLTPSPEADRYTLARRVALDLTGLPPTLEMAERFVNDKRGDAYERYVHELLDSPAYGERWASVWLDLARYADSSGYAEDNPRVIWMYRDWVIRAINKNTLFDRFTIEQLAGDLLPNPTDDQRLATAFHRNTPSNDEGGTDDEEFRTAAVVDRVNTTMQVWMGLTMACAQCHDHKYDPLTQEEYFQMFAIFNQTEDTDKRDLRPTTMRFSADQLKRKREIAQKIAALETIIAKKRAETTGGTPRPRRKGPLSTRFVRVEHLGKNDILSLAEMQAFAGGTNIARKGKARQSSTAFNGPAKLALDGNTNGDYNTAKSTTHTNQSNQPWWEVDLGKARVLERIALWNRTDNGLARRLNAFRIIALDGKRQPLWVKTIRKFPNPSVVVTLPPSADKLTKADLQEIDRYGPATGIAAAERRQVAALKKQLAGIKGVTTPVMRELPKNKKRKTHIMIRGNFLDKGRQVMPGVPSLFPPIPKNVAHDRLALAKWLLAEDNPLTARVTVNRFWEQIFGRGLVETSEDFGIRGRLPSHPEMLDWLAIEFVREKWDVKKLLKQIVTSAAYRQASYISPMLLKRDPGNRLLARGPRRRHSAEMIRDQALFVSSLLSKKMYGSPARPPRPNFGLRAAFGRPTDWKTSAGEDKYRRALYTEWRRSIPYPSMVTFDAQNRNVCVVKRPVTNTPLQPLVTMNDPVYVEAAQALARRIVKEGGKTTTDRVRYGIRVCLIRSPKTKEVERLIKLYETVRARFAKDPKAAELLATRPLGPLPPDADFADMAAWTVVGNVLINLDEMFLKR